MNQGPRRWVTFCSQPGGRALLSALALNEPGEMLRLPRQLRETFAAILLESSKSEPEIGMVWKLLDTFDKNRPAP